MRKKFFIMLLIFFSCLLVSQTAMATAPVKRTSEAGTGLIGQDMAFSGAAGYDDSATVGGIAANLISVALGLLGVAFIGLLIYGGYTWMIARGNEDEAKKALNIIQMAVIGLVIVVAAYSITYFVFSAMSSATFNAGGMD